jgi:cytosine/adenosine deaminase-related metal-dependent hydrolase
VRRLADEIGCPVTTHVAQSEAELQVVAERYGGRSPVEYLDWVGLLGSDLLAAHCIHAPPRDLETLRHRGTTVINCTRTFSRGAVAAPFGRFTANGLRTVIGTDGYNMDLVTELGAAGLVAKLTATNSSIATARDLVRAATTDAAAALRRPDLGRIAPGCPADLVAFDLGRPHLQPVSDPLQALIWRGSGADLWLSMVDGQVLVDEGVYQISDEATIATAGAAAIEKVWGHPSATRFLTQVSPPVPSPAR